MRMGSVFPFSGTGTRGWYSGIFYITDMPPQILQIGRELCVLGKGWGLVA